MPELPEVESLVRELEPQVLHQKAVGFRSSWPRAVLGASTRQASARIRGRQVESLDRRGKYFRIRFSGPFWAVGHLRMSGNLIWAESGTKTPYLRHRLLFEGGHELHFRDMRKFGRLWFGADPADHLAHLGPEPLEAAWTAKRLEGDLAVRKRALKPLLLDQGFVAGLGNIYVDEALFRAGLHPLRPANSVTQDECRRLHRAIRFLLRRAIQAGGTAFDSALVRPDGSPQGRYQPRLRVYGRSGAPCDQCQTLLERSVIGQRGTVICPICQPASAVVAG